MSVPDTAVRLRIGTVAQCLGPWRSRCAHLWRAMRSELGCLVLAGVASGVYGVCVNRHGYVLCFVLAVTVLVGLGWPWLTVVLLRAQMAFDQTRGRESEPVNVVLRVRNLAPWPSWGAGLLCSCGTDLGAPTLMCPGWRSSALEWKFVPPRRGLHPEGEVWLTCGFPFGLWTARRMVRVNESLLAWPAATAVPMPAELAAASETPASRHCRAGADGDVLGLRPFRRGEPLRLVNWRQTARHDQIARQLTSAVGRHTSCTSGTKAACIGLAETRVGI